jgi:hypothetical protein
LSCLRVVARLLLGFVLLTVTLSIKFPDLLQLILTHALFEPSVARLAVNMFFYEFFRELLSGNVFYLGEEVQIKGLSDLIDAMPPA